MFLWIFRLDSTLKYLYQEFCWSVVMELLSCIFCILFLCWYYRVIGLFCCSFCSVLYPFCCCTLSAVLHSVDFFWFILFRSTAFVLVFWFITYRSLRSYFFPALRAWKLYFVPYSLSSFIFTSFILWSTKFAGVIVLIPSAIFCVFPCSSVYSSKIFLRRISVCSLLHFWLLEADSLLLFHDFFPSATKVCMVARHSIFGWTAPSFFTPTSLELLDTISAPRYTISMIGSRFYPSSMLSFLLSRPIVSSYFALVLCFVFLLVFFERWACECHS